MPTREEKREGLKDLLLNIHLTPELTIDDLTESVLSYLNETAEEKLKERYKIWEEHKKATKVIPMPSMLIPSDIDLMANLVIERLKEGK